MTSPLARQGAPAPKRPFASWSWLPSKLITYLVMCHYGHLLEFIVAYIFYRAVWPLTFRDAATLSFSWISKVVAFNLACEVLFYGGWHWMMYAGKFLRAPPERNGAPTMHAL